MFEKHLFGVYYEALSVSPSLIYLMLIRTVNPAIRSWTSKETVLILGHLENDLEWLKEIPLGGNLGHPYSKLDRFAISSCALQKYIHEVHRLLIQNKNDNAKWWWGFSSHTRPFPVWSHSGEFSARPPAPASPSTAWWVLFLKYLVNCAKHKGKNSILTTAGNHLMPWSMKFDYPYLSLSLNQKLLLWIQAQSSIYEMIQASQQK